MKKTIKNHQHIELSKEVRSVAKVIDLTNLDLNTTEQKIEELCLQAVKYGFASVCIRPDKVKLVSDLFFKWKEKDVQICTVVDFPFGNSTPQEKAEETRIAIQNGAKEIDMVLDYEAILRGEIVIATEGVRQVVNVAQEAGDVLVKVILETAKLRRLGGKEAIVAACDAVIIGRADYAKTSTGYAIEGGATIEDVRLLVQILHPKEIKVKASGGIRDAEMADQILSIGTDRLGMKLGIQMIEEKIRLVEKHS